MPLWQLLGGKACTRAVQLVEGYALLNETDDAFAARLAARVEQGFTRLKIEAAHYADSNQLCRRLKTFREMAGIGPRLILDFAWTWRDARSRLDLAHQLEAIGIDWIEDPFPRMAVQEYAALKTGCRTAIGCGDEATRPADMMKLIEGGAIDVVRLDATTIGGIESVREIGSEAHRRGLRVSLHEHPEVHQHCAFAWDFTDHIEIFPTDRPFDRVHDLIQSPPLARVTNGRLESPQEPGSGIRLNEAGLNQFSVRYSKVER